MKILDKVRGVLAERKRLRGPTRLHYAIADRLSMLDAGAWRALTADASFFLSHNYLAAIEPVLPANIAPRYALLYDGDTPLAAVYMQLAGIGLSQVRSKGGSATAGKRRSALGELSERATQRVLTCGNLLSYGQHGVALGKGADAGLVWHGVAEVLYRVRQADQLRGDTHFVMIKDVHEPYTKSASSLTNLSYRYVSTEPNMVLALEEGWKSYDDYLAGLSSKYRSGIRNQVLKPMEAAGCRVELLADLAPHEARLHELYRSVLDNASVRPFMLRPEYFNALHRIPEGRARCSAVMRGDDMLGFLLSVADGDTAFAYHIGFDRTAAAELPLYLRLLHAGIAEGIALGCKRISYGRTALEPKASLGAKPQPYGILVRHSHPVLNKVIKGLLLGIESEAAPERNPFKKSA